MTWPDYWEKLCVATPDLRNEDSKMSLPVGRFKGAMLCAYIAGVCDEKGRREAAGDFDKVSKGSNNPVLDMFNTIFK